MTKRTTVWIVALVLMFGLSLPVLAQKPTEPLRILRLHGWVVDEGTASRHANTESKDAVLASYEEGVPLIFVTLDGDVYPLVEQEDALEHVGQAWDVIATLRPDGTLKVGSYIQPKKKKPVDPKVATGQEESSD